MLERLAVTTKAWAPVWGITLSFVEGCELSTVILTSKSENQNQAYVNASLTGGASGRSSVIFSSVSSKLNAFPPKGLRSDLGGCALLFVGPPNRFLKAKLPASRPSDFCNFWADISNRAAIVTLRLGIDRSHISVASCPFVFKR